MANLHLLRERAELFHEGQEIREARHNRALIVDGNRAFCAKPKAEKTHGDAVIKMRCNFGTTLDATHARAMYDHALRLFVDAYPARAQPSAC